MPGRLLGIQKWIRPSLTSRSSESGGPDGEENMYSQSSVLSNDTDEHRWDMTIEQPERQHLTACSEAHECQRELSGWQILNLSL